MIRDLMSGAASVEDALTLWASSLRDAKQRIRPLFTQERVAASVGQFLDGLLANEPRKTGWMRAEASGDPGRVCRGMAMPSSTGRSTCQRMDGRPRSPEGSACPECTTGPISNWPILTPVNTTTSLPGNGRGAF